MTSCHHHHEETKNIPGIFPSTTLILLLFFFFSFTDILSPFTYYDFRRLGCFSDSQARTIPSLEGQDPVLDGDYTIRQDAVRKCVLAAKKRGHKVIVVMANGQCSSGADTAKIFAKFGHGETGCSAMRDIHRVYNYDYGSIDGMTDGCS